MIDDTSDRTPARRFLRSGKRAIVSIALVTMLGAIALSPASAALVPETRLTAGDGAVSVGFGTRVSVEGDTALGGGTLHGDVGLRSGATSLFTRNGSAGTQQAPTSATDGPEDGPSGADHVEPAASDGVAGESGASVSPDDESAVIDGPRHHEGETGADSQSLIDLALDGEGPLASDVATSPDPLAVESTTILTAFVDDATTGGSTVASAAYSIDGSAYQPLDAADGAYDEVAEKVTGSIGPITKGGVYEVCVRGKDAADITGAADCTVLSVPDPPDDQQPPACPEGLHAEVHDDGNPMLRWNASRDADRYHVYRASGGNAFVQAAEVDATSHMDIGAEAGTTYTYEVTAANQAGESDGCGRVEVTAVPFFGSPAFVAMAVIGSIGILISARPRRG